MTILLVRHAHAGQRERWDADDSRRPLSAKGRRQAEGLVDLLASYEVGRILTSRYDRCVQTVEPLGGALGVDVEHADELVEGADPADTRRMALALDGATTVLCSHGDVIGSFIGRLRADGVELLPTVDWQKGSTWVLERDGNRIVRGRYLPPPA